jgi:predicted Zn-dependent protease
MTRPIIVLLALLLMIGTPAVDAAPPPTPDEVQIGRQIALQLETRYKVLNDAALTERMNRIAEAVVAVADRPGVTYVFKVLDVDVANALSLPGGFVYITKPMFEFVRSDHELAAIIAHEVAHIAHVHGMEMLRRQSQAALITILIAALTRDPAVAQGVQLASLSALAHYTRDLERDADLTALAYLQKTAYAPVGLLTLMERFAWEEQYRAVAYQGVADHPKTAERVAYIEQELRRRGLPIVRRVAANYLRLTVREVKDRSVAGGELLVNDRVIFRLPNLDRVREVAERLDRLFNADLRSFEVGVRSHGETWVVAARGAPLVTVTAQDAAWNETTVKELAMTVHARLRAAMEEDLRRRKLSG